MKKIWLTCRKKDDMMQIHNYVFDNKKHNYQHMPKEEKR